MGFGGPFRKSCYTNYNVSEEILPNPDPSKWKLISHKLYDNSYVLKVKYFNCTNFEGVKILVFKGSYKPTEYMDPHFSKTLNSPFARFIPTEEGWKAACELAENLNKNKRKKK